MLTLKLFGPPAIESAGRLVTGRAAQGHRLGLLAVLALARGRSVARDKLVALLWPESAPDRARHQLSDALYIVRTAFGVDVIRSTGDDLLLNPEALATDVGTFEQLLDDGRPELAVDSFAGPLMDGFHLSDGAEFERWLDGERARLGQRYSGALETVAEASEKRGDLTAAATWWRKLAAHDPYSGRVASRLMRALDAAGDRAGALKHARIHAALLRQEFEAEPDRGVTALAERLRLEPPNRGVAGPPSPAPSETAAAAAPAVRSAVVSDAQEGLALQSETDSTTDADAAPERRRWRARRYVGVAALLLLAVAAAYNLSRAREAAPPTARSLAVLPFVNMSPDPSNAYFSDGLSEQIITALSHINGLRVAARTSSFALRDDKLDVRVIGDTLDVEAVLEGSVRRDGNRLRVTAQLIDAATGYHIWSDDYDREIGDVLAVQDEIARAIAGALELRLPARAGAPRVHRAPDPAAYDLYLRALHLRDDLSGDALQAGAGLLDRAIELEPGFALAYATKAAIVGPRVYYGHVAQEQGVAEMRVAIARALELDPELGEAHVALGILKLFFDWDWDAAERALRRALELNPSDPHAWHHLGNHLRAVGRLEEAVDARAQSVTLDPLNARMRIVLTMDLMVAGRLDEALAEYHRTQRLDPMIPQTLGLGPYPPVGGRILLLAGRNEEAVQEFVRIAALRGATGSELDTLRNAFVQRGVRGFWRGWLDMDLRQTGSGMSPLRLAVLWAHIGDVDQALDWLERAHAERNPGIIFLREEHAFAELRTHPRFVRIVRELKLPDR